MSQIEYDITFGQEFNPRIAKGMGGCGRILYNRIKSFFNCVVVEANLSRIDSIFEDCARDRMLCKHFLL